MPTPTKHPSHAARQAAYRQRQAQARAAELHAKGLPPLPTIPTLPGTRRWTAMTEHACHLLNRLHEEMQHYADERSEQWQESERAEQHQEYIDTIEEALALLQELPTPAHNTRAPAADP